MPSSEGVYSLKATLQASEYDPSSSLSTEFHINVICKPSTIASSVAELSYTYTMRLNQTILAINFKDFQMTPECLGKQVQYESTLADGSPLPSFIAFNSAQRQFVVQYDSSMEEGKYLVKVTGSIGTLKAHLDIFLTVEGEDNIEDILSSGIQLPQVDLTVYT